MREPPPPRPAEQEVLPSAQDDFGFGAELAEPAPAHSRTSDAAPSSDSPDGEPRRRRRRRGGRGRGRRGAPGEPSSPVGEAPAEFAPERHAAPERQALPEREPHPAREPDREPTADDFGVLPEDVPPAPAAERFAAEPAFDRDDRGQRDRRDHSRGRPDRFAPSRPAEAAPEPRPAAPRLRQPHGVHEWFSPERLDACQRAIHYHFRDLGLLENALTHSSIKSDDRPSYERMEFLGDSVIGLVIAEYLYNLLPDCDEGELTKVKSMVVSTDGLADAAKVCGLDRFLAVGRGILMKDAVPRSLVADVFEGVVGAVYLDRGYETVRLYILDLLRPHIEKALSDRGARNFKSVLQQVAQRDSGETPYYEVLRESGPEHSRVFEVAAVVGRRRFGVARAPTKKEAEQAAAKLALQTILVEKSSRKSAPRRRRPR
jgi:ribonuclease III